MEDEKKMFKAQQINPQTEQEFLHWFKSLIFADDLKDVDKLARFTEEFIIEGSGATVRFKNGHIFEINVANHYTTHKQLCDECQKLIGAPRHTSPHANLICTGKKAFSSIMGSADETYYTCKVCGHEWLHETGSCGCGWIK